MAWAVNQYHQCLLEAPEADAARRYLQERGITAESIERFQLGFSPLERDWILRSVKEKGSGEAIAAPGKDFGDDRHPQSSARGRKPLRSLSRPPVVLDPRRSGTSCRHRRPGAARVGYEEPGKIRQFARNTVVHETQSALRARPGPRIAEEKQDGAGDGRLHRRDRRPPVRIHECRGRAWVPQSGESHIRLLKAHADRIVLVLDGDEAGTRRANEVLELFIAQQADSANPRTARRPRSLRLSAQIRGRGVPANCWTTKAVDALDHAFEVTTRGIDVERDIHGTGQAIERLLGIVAKAPRLSGETRGDAQDSRAEDRAAIGGQVPRRRAGFASPAGGLASPRGHANAAAASRRCRNGADPTCSRPSRPMRGSLPCCN